MKSLLFFAALTLSGFAAQAQSDSAQFVSTHGQFVASSCGKTVVDSDFGLASPIEEVCIGQMPNLTTLKSEAAVQFRLESGKSKAFRIVQVDNLLVALLSGKTKSVFTLAADDGQQFGMKVINAADGHVESAQGLIAGHPFLVKSFELILHAL